MTRLFRGKNLHFVVTFGLNESSQPEKDCKYQFRRDFLILLYPNDTGHLLSRHTVYHALIDRYDRKNRV